MLADGLEGNAKMNYKTTIVLLVLAAAVAGYFFLVERGAQTSYEREQIAAESQGQDGQPLFTEDVFDTNKIDHITLTRDGSEVELRKVDGQWQQVSPVMFPLNSWSASKITDDAAQLSYVDRFKPGQAGNPTLADTALESPSVVAKLQGSDITQTLRLGKRSVGGKAYLMVNDDPQVYVVNDALHRTLLRASVSDWRKKTIDAPQSTAASRMTITRTGQADLGDITLVKRDGKWYLNEAATERADGNAAAKLIESISSMSISKFITDSPDDPALLGLSSPQLVATIYTPVVSVPGGGESAPQTASADDETAHTLRVGSAADLTGDSFFATWSVSSEHSPVVFTLSKADVEKLRRPANELRDANMLTAVAKDIRQLAVTRDGQAALTLIRDMETGFAFGEPKPDYAVDYNTARNLLDQLTGIKANGYVADFSAVAAGKPIAELELTLSSGLGESVTFYSDAVSAAGDAEDATYLAMRQGEPVAYRVKAEEVAPLLAGPLALRDKELLNLTPAQVQTVTLTHGDTTYRFTRGQAETAEAATTQPDASQPANADLSWQLQGQDTFEHDALAQLLTALKPLRVERWLDEPADSDAGDITLTLELVEGSPKVLRADSQTRKASLTGVASGFTLSQAFVDQLSAEYRQRTVLDLAASQIQTVTIESDSNTATVQKNDADQYVTSDGETLNQEAAAGLFDTLAGLRVQRYLTKLPDNAAADRSLTIRTTTGDAHRLQLYTASRGEQVQAVGLLADQVFTLDPQTAGKLTAELAAAPAE